jgi:hypothetical protein
LSSSRLLKVHLIVMPHALSLPRRHFPSFPMHSLSLHLHDMSNPR